MHLKKKKKKIETGVKMRQKVKKGIIAQRIKQGQEIYVDVQKKC